MSGYDYREAQKLAVKEYKKATARGESPYPIGLERIVSSGQMSAGRNLGLEQIPLALVVGTKHEGRNNAFARNFMPLLSSSSEFADKWITLCDAHLNEGIREPVKLYEYRNRFYVEEGNKRVSILKYFEADSVDAYVIRIPSARDGSEEAELYDAFLQFHDWSRLRTVEFSCPGSYERLQHLVGKKPGEAWTEDERTDFLSFYYYFHKEYVSIGKGKTLRSLCDDMLAFIEMHGYEKVRDLSPSQIKELLRQPIRKTMRILAVADDESKYYYEYYSPGKLDDFDLIIACGDLHKVYLEFLTTMASCPVLYVRGNHDDPFYFSNRIIFDERFRAVEDYSVLTACGHRILCVGGAVSIDRALRTAGQDWWTDEAPVFSAEAVDSLAVNNIYIDTVVTHTAPSFCEFTLPAGSVNSEDLLRDMQQERLTMDRLLGALLRDHHPLRRWYYGHFHQSWNADIDGIRYTMLGIKEMKMLNDIDS